jgi:transcriptional regulator with XRE-family HTH domain
MDEIAHTVLRQLNRRSMTIVELAARTGVDRDVIGRWLSGRRTIKLRYLLPIMRELGLEVTVKEDRHARPDPRVHRRP